jgi:hypothetical protein
VYTHHRTPCGVKEKEWLKRKIVEEGHTGLADL